MTQKHLEGIDALHGLLDAFVARSRLESQGNSLLDKKASDRYNASVAKKRTKKLTDQLRQAIDDSGLTRYAIAKETGIDESALAKFYNGHRGLSMKALNSLGAYLELTINLGIRGGLLFRRRAVWRTSDTHEDRRPKGPRPR